jgi:TM2 domain-containing membrane protein YozV
MQYNYEKICPNCGTRLDKDAMFCTKCGAKQPDTEGCAQNNNGYNNQNQTMNNNSNQYSEQVEGINTKWLATLLLCFFVGCFGVHRFYNRRIGTGILMLITGGLCGIWTIIDLIMIVVGKFKDNNGNYIRMK